MSEKNEMFEVQTDSKGFNIKDFVIRYIKYLPLLLLSLVVSFFAAKIKIRYTPELFTSSGTMLIKNDDKVGRSDKSIEDFFTNKAENDLNTEIEIMKSRRLMQRVVRKLNLQSQLFTKGKVKTSIVYENQPIRLNNISREDSANGLSYDIKIVNENSFKIGTNPTLYTFGQPLKPSNSTIVEKTTFFNQGYIDQNFILQFRKLDNTAGALAGGISIILQGLGTRVLKVSTKERNPQLCADVVNSLMEEYILENKEKNREVSAITKAFIDSRVSELENEVGNIENAVREFREKTQAINIDAQSQQYLANANDANKLLSEQLLILGKTRSLIEVFLKDSEVKNYAPIGTLDDANLQNLILRFNELQLMRKQIRNTQTELDKTYIEKTNDVQRLRNTIIEGLSKLASITELTVSDLEKKYKENVMKLDKVPGLQQELLNYERDRKIKEELYLFLKKKGEEASISNVTTLSNSEVIDKALVNPTPIEPVPSKLYSLFLFVGLLVPLVLAYLLEAFDDKVRYRDDITRVTKAPIIAEVGHNDDVKTLVVASKSRKVIAEQFRMIRTNVQYLVGSKEKYCVLVTSTFSGEGKSFVSTNMAAAIALSGRKTVLLEFDLRKPKVLEGLGMKKGVGISNYVVGKTELHELVRPVEGHENLYVIGSGAIPPNPAELLLEQKISTLFAYLQENFDTIIIDSAPVGLVTDSMTLSKFADSTIYIVRHKYTLKRQIKLIDELYTQQKLPKLALVLNDVVGNTGGYYGYGGYGYGYGKKTYGYGTGYFEEEQKSFIKDAWNKIKNFFIFWK
jgi:capsular exopolysaccharide synthesis family protein